MSAWHEGLNVDKLSGKHASELGGAGIPSGVIAMWSGLKANIPSGWALCDGQGGRPDLRDRFILGVPDGEEAGGVGGSLSLTHSGVTVADHPATTTDVADVGATQRGTTSSTLTLKAHKHPIPASTHAITQPNNHPDIRPPFYKLAFIIKL